MRFMGLDPGAVNFAIAVLDDGVLVHACMFHDTISSMKLENAHLRGEFRRAIYKILKHWRPDELMAEQFVVRGFGANSIELVAMMLGGIQVVADHLRIKEHAVMASTWKLAFKREGNDLDRAYAEAKKLRVPPHVVDAILIANFLMGSRTFMDFNLKRHRSNVLAARKMLAPEDLIPLPRRKKAKKR